MGRTRRICVAATALVAITLAVDVAAASNVAAGLGERGDVSVPTWLYALTGGAVIGASGLMSMLVTDRELLEVIHEQHLSIGNLPSARRLVHLAGGAAGLLGLVAIVGVGFFGPDLGQVNLGVLLVFVVGRAGLTIVAYLFGNPWPAIDPWRRIASVLPTGQRSYPAALGSWPAVGALAVLVWIEIAFPVTGSPDLLAGLVVLYTIYTLAGAVAFGRDAWFRHCDPVSVWFRFYGAVGPLQRTRRLSARSASEESATARSTDEATRADGGVARPLDDDGGERSGDDGYTYELRPFGARLRGGGVLSDRSEVAFAVLLVWELTFSGMVATPVGAGAFGTVANLGIPTALVYLLAFAIGYPVFLGAFRFATRASRERAETYLAEGYLARRFAAPLLAIAAGYHFAHYAGFSVSLSPALLDVATDPFGALDVTVLALPWWFAHVGALAVLTGHVLAVWVAHATAIETFPGRVQAIRSQYPYVLLMAGFTILSLWIISMATVSPA